MTEKQIEQLKKVLATSNLPENSSELDELILKSARESAPLNRDHAGSRRGTIRSLSLLPISFMRSATLAVVVTLAVFFAMGQWVSVEESIVAVKLSETDVGVVIPRNSTQVPSQMVIVRPNNVALEPAPSQLSRDQILMSFELSDTDALLAELSFEFSQNPTITQGNIEVAMVDIDSLIQTGELDHARQRYSHLKTECGSCPLPDTLEALVLEAKVIASRRDNAFETG